MVAALFFTLAAGNAAAMIYWARQDGRRPTPGRFVGCAAAWLGLVLTLAVALAEVSR